MSEFTQEDFDENIALIMKVIQAGQEYVADCARIGMKIVDKFNVIAKSNDGTNSGNEKMWKEVYLSTGNLGAARGSHYGSSASLSRHSRSSSRASSASGCTPCRRVDEQPLPMDDSSYQLGDKSDEILRMMRANAEQQQHIMDRLAKLEAKKKKKKLPSDSVTTCNSSVNECAAQ